MGSNQGQGPSSGAYSGAHQGNPFTGGRASGFKSQTGNPGGFNFDENIFSGFESFFGGGMGQQAYNPKGQDIIFSINIDFDEAIRGTRKMASFLKPTPCNTCHGSKMAPGTTPEKCSTCDGQGFKNLKQGNMHLRMMCGNCHGVGTIIKQFCGTCKGTGVGSVKQTEEFVIPKGINNGQSLRFVGKVNIFLLLSLIIKGGIGENGAPPGDLILQVNVNPHSYFRREGFNICTDVYIPISKVRKNKKLS